jgi:hypothetical protein
VCAGFFADIDFFNTGARVAEKLGIAEIVIDKHIGPLDAGAALQREEKRITGTGAHQKTNSLRHDA